MQVHIYIQGDKIYFTFKVHTLCQFTILFITTFSSFLTCLYVKKIWACKLVEGLLDHVSFNIKISKFCIGTESNADHNLINRCTLHPNHNQVKAYNQN